MASYNPEKPAEAYPPQGAGAPQQASYGQPQETVYAQPTAQMPMAPGGAFHPNPLNKPLDDNGQRHWDHGLFACVDCGTCCTACWCPCLVYGRNKTRYAALQNGQVHPEGGEACGSDGMIYCCLQSFLGAGWILQCMQRGELRERYNIRGNGCKDCCISGFCIPADLIQQSREIEDEENALTGKGRKHDR